MPDDASEADALTSQLAAWEEMTHRLVTYLMSSVMGVQAPSYRWIRLTLFCTDTFCKTVMSLYVMMCHVSAAGASRACAVTSTDIHMGGGHA